MLEKYLKLVELDPWLEPAAEDVKNRYWRYKNKLEEIKSDFGSLYEFAGGHHYFGFNFDLQKRGWFYREWAPKAHALFLTGDFNFWNENSHPLARDSFGTWSIFLPFDDYKDTFVHGSKVKVIVHSQAGMHYRIPAYIRKVEQDETTKDFSGILWFPGTFDWKGDVFTRQEHENLLIYECHIGMAQEKEGIGSYSKFTKNILPRIKKAGYTAIQLMAVQEHPYYGSFGYHVSNFFAPSSRFGEPEDLKLLIRTAHEMGLVVIMDLVHSHTVKNINEGLNEFDGSDDQYFHPGERGEHPAWDSKIFDYGKTEVLRFLLSNVRYWLEEFHFDGFRFDGVGSMMYFHHGNEVIDSREKFFTQGVEWGAITYLQLSNTLIHHICEHAITIAEDVTGMPGLTVDPEEGGIGFDYRLGMGLPDFWIRYLKERKDEEWDLTEIWNTLNDRLWYVNTVSYCESHDQALVGDKTLAFWLMDKEMYWNMSKEKENLVVDRGIALHKMIRLLTISLGGQAYLNFMGNEFGHPEWIDFPREGNNWSYHYARRQWSLLDDKNLKYHYLADFDREMLRVVKEYNILNAWYAQQLNLDHNNKVMVFERNLLVFIFNFNPVNSFPDYEQFVPEEGEYEIILNTDDSKFGGFGRVDMSISYPTYHKEDGDSNFTRLYIPSRTAFVLKKK